MLHRGDCQFQETFDDLFSPFVFIYFHDLLLLYLLVLPCIHHEIDANIVFDFFPKFNHESRPKWFNHNVFALKNIQTIFFVTIDLIPSMLAFVGTPVFMNNFDKLSFSESFSLPWFAFEINPLNVSICTSFNFHHDPSQRSHSGPILYLLIFLFNIICYLVILWFQGHTWLW